MYLRLVFLFSLISYSTFSQTATQLKFTVTVDQNLKETWKEKGRLVLYLSKNGERAPLFQGTFASGRSGFAKNINAWKFDELIEFDAMETFTASEFTLDNVFKYGS